MKVTILGSGTVDPVPERASTGFFLEADGAVLIDLGAGALRRGVEAGLPLTRVQTLVLTHHHPDHTSDLVPFLFARKYGTDPWRGGDPLTVYGPAGTREFLERVMAAWPSIRPQDGLAVVELEPEHAPRELPEGPTLSTFPAVHGDMTALCLRFEHQGKAVAFSGDTALCPGVSQAARQADLFFCECSCFPRGVEPLYCRQVHLSWEDVAEVCREASPQRLILTHLYEPVLARRPNPLDSLTEALSIPVTLAVDRDVYIA
jgi:ribonuclease BN (tRNA processing enzyme)